MIAIPMNRVDGFSVIPGTGSGPRLDTGRDAMTYNQAGRDNTPAPCPVASPVVSTWDRRDAWHILATLPAAGLRAKDGRVRQVGANNGMISGSTFGQ